MRLLMRLLPTLATLTALGCSESTVPKGQIILNLVQVDGAYLPASIDTQQGAKIRIEDGRLGEGIDGTCDFQIRFFSGSSFSPINGTVPDCKLKEGQSVTVRIDMTTQIGVGEHLYNFR